MCAVLQQPTAIEHAGTSPAFASLLRLFARSGLPLCGPRKSLEIVVSLLLPSPSSAHCHTDGRSPSKRQRSMDARSPRYINGQEPAVTRLEFGGTSVHLIKKCYSYRTECANLIYCRVCLSVQPFVSLCILYDAVVSYY